MNMFLSKLNNDYNIQIKKRVWNRIPLLNFGKFPHWNTNNILIKNPKQNKQTKTQHDFLLPLSPSLKKKKAQIQLQNCWNANSQYCPLFLPRHQISQQHRKIQKGTTLIFYFQIVAQVPNEIIVLTQPDGMLCSSDGRNQGNKNNHNLHNRRIPWWQDRTIRSARMSANGCSYPQCNLYVIPLPHSVRNTELHRLMAVSLNGQLADKRE